MNRKQRLLKYILNSLGYSLITILLIWGFTSLVEIAIKNLSPNPEYSVINLITLLINLIKGGF